MKTALAIMAVLLMIGAMGMVGTHTVPSLSVFSTQLQNNPSVTFTMWDYRSIETGHVNVSMKPLSGVFSYASNPIVISSWQSNGLSSAFGDSGNVSGFSNNSEIYITIIWNVLYKSVNNNTFNNIYPRAYTNNITSMGAFGSTVFTGQITFPTFRMAGQFNGVVELQGRFI